MRARAHPIVLHRLIQVKANALVVSPQQVTTRRYQETLSTSLLVNAEAG
jgi:hypothetical protein